VKARKSKDAPIYNPSNVIKVEFYHQDSTRHKRKISVRKGEFAPPTVLQNHRTHQWFLWDKLLGVYREVPGAILEAIEVKNEEAAN
jgi:hypothetical protein